MSRPTIKGMLLGYRYVLPIYGVLTQLSEFVSRRLKKYLYLHVQTDTGSPHPPINYARGIKRPAREADNWSPSVVPKVKK